MSKVKSEAEWQTIFRKIDDNYSYLCSERLYLTFFFKYFSLYFLSMPAGTKLKVDWICKPSAQVENALYFLRKEKEKERNMIVVILNSAN